MEMFFLDVGSWGSFYENMTQVSLGRLAKWAEREGMCLEI